MPFTRSVASFLALVLLLGACTGGSEDADDGATEPTEGSPGQIAVSAGADAAVGFVTNAIEGREAGALLATEPLPDGQQGAPFDRSLLLGRLDELRAFSGVVSEIRPSTTAYTDDPELGPACTRPTGLVCQVDLVGTSGLLASVVVHSFGDGVTDFTILNRGAGGSVTGIGLARCSAGFTVLHGGHTDRFDIAICVDGSGRAEYSGAERGTDLSIGLEACQDSDRRWIADNEGFVYIVDGSESPVRTVLDVRNPAGDTIEEGTLTSVEPTTEATASSC